MKDDNGPDTDLVLTFFAVFGRFEQALKKAGFTKSGRHARRAQADWEGFARHIEGRFDPEATPELQGAVLYMLGMPTKRQTRRAIPVHQNDILQLATLIQGMGTNLSHSLNFEHTPDSDNEVMLAAVVILEAWSHCDPNVERILNDRL